jgi:hypothetical protein
MFEEPLKSIAISKAEALLLLARADSKRCQGGTYLLRVLSNYAAVGADVGSGRVKKKNPRMSEKAAQIRNKEGVEAFIRKTINEHPEPLDVVWKWIVEHGATLSAADIVRRICSYPMVTITKEEDSAINKLGFRKAGKPEDRFAAAKIMLIDGASLRHIRKCKEGAQP